MGKSAIITSNLEKVGNIMHTKDLIGGKIYKSGRMYYLILLGTDTAFEYWCSIDKDKDNLININTYTISTPNGGWQYVETLSDEQYKQALHNFRKTLKHSSKIEMCRK